MDKLTKKEQEHLKGNEVTTLTLLKRMREDQGKMTEKYNRETCWDCRFIAKKLGVE